MMLNVHKRYLNGMDIWRGTDGELDAKINLYLIYPIVNKFVLIQFF